jgi:hypothetical protein
VNKQALRLALLAKHPEWEKRIYIFEDSITIKGIGNVAFCNSAEKYLEAFERLANRALSRAESQTPRS